MCLGWWFWFRNQKLMFFVELLFCLIRHGFVTELWQSSREKREKVILPYGFAYWLLSAHMDAPSKQLQQAVFLGQWGLDLWKPRQPFPTSICFVPTHYSNTLSHIYVKKTWNIPANNCLHSFDGFSFFALGKCVSWQIG